MHELNSSKVFGRLHEKRKKQGMLKRFYSPYRQWLSFIALRRSHTAFSSPDKKRRTQDRTSIKMLSTNTSHRIRMDQCITFFSTVPTAKIENMWKIQFCWRSITRPSQTSWKSSRLSIWATLTAMDPLHLYRISGRFLQSLRLWL